jgi:hypothetical protein
VPHKQTLLKCINASDLEIFLERKWFVLGSVIYEERSSKLKRFDFAQISLGDSRSYYLSTAKNEYGVIFAKSVAGATMVPISWNMMQCPKTKSKEFRKVAKVVSREDN